MTADGLEEHLLANSGPLLRFLRARGAGDEADDVLQDLWLKIDRRGANHAIADSRSYLFRMADNLMHDRTRAARRRTQREHAWGETGHGPSGEDETPSAERALAARQQLREVERALATLGARSQSVFRRFRIDGISQGKIAQDEGISLSAVEKHLQRAYRIISQFTEDHEETASLMEHAAD